MKMLMLQLILHLAPVLGWVSPRSRAVPRLLSMPSSYCSQIRYETAAFMADNPTLENDGEKDTNKVAVESEKDKEMAVGNLVADDEWLGISMELSEVVRTAVVEDLKKNAREFLGKDEYKVGDISKELDARVKEEIAKFRGKEEYDLGDFVMAMDETSKMMAEQLTGKPYEAGDLSKELDSRIRSAMADYAGKDSYEFGDLTRTVTARIQKRVEEFTGKPYEFADISRKVEEQRQKWVKDFLGEEAASNYQFGDITKKSLANFMGKDEYQFGYVSKTILGDLFGKQKGTDK